MLQHTAFGTFSGREFTASSASTLHSSVEILSRNIRERANYEQVNLESILSFLDSLQAEHEQKRSTYPTVVKLRSTTTRRVRTTKETRSTRRTTTAVSPSTTVSSSELKPVDSVFILLCAFLIFNIQTGFGLLEGGIVSSKNETNILLKNLADIIFGGFMYWVFGYGITYGTWKGSSSVFGFGYYAVDSDIDMMGDLFSSFFFQLSFATTATTIVSGALAERCNYKAYCLYSLVATVTYSVGARWVWGPGGFLKNLGAIDFAGSGVVHLVGGFAALVGAWFVGPRLGRFETGPPPMGNPTNALLGTLALWWGWLAFNAGSTFGVTKQLWKFAARAATTTIIASIGGGMVGMIWGFVKPGKFFHTDILINSVLGALVGITASCAVVHTPEAFATGVIGAIIVLLALNFTDVLKIDDAVGATAVHGFGGIWGLLAVGFFADDDEGILDITKGNSGLIRGGGWYLLGIQTLTAVCLAAWSMISTFFLFLIINLIIPFRVTPEEELLGLDFTEHGIRRRGIGVSPTISVFQSNPDVRQINGQIPGDTGQNNLGHEVVTNTLRVARSSHPENVIVRSGKIKSFKGAAEFARAFKKLQSRGARVTPRDRQYIMSEHSSMLRSSNESLEPNRPPGVVAVPNGISLERGPVNQDSGDRRIIALTFPGYQGRSRTPVAGNGRVDPRTTDATNYDISIIEVPNRIADNPRDSDHFIHDQLRYLP